MANTPKPIRKEVKKRMKSHLSSMKENISKGISSKGVLRVAKKMKKDTIGRIKHDIKIGRNS